MDGNSKRLVPTRMRAQGVCYCHAVAVLRSTEAATVRWLPTGPLRGPFRSVLHAGSRGAGPVSAQPEPEVSAALRAAARFAVWRRWHMASSAGRPAAFTALALPRRSGS